VNIAKLPELLQKRRPYLQKRTSIERSAMSALCQGALPDRAGIKVPEIVEVTVFRQDKVSADFFLSIAEDFQCAFQTARRVVNDDVLDGNQFVRKVGAGMINAFQFLAPVLQQRHRQRRA
jgi:hypothetical protein